MLKKRCVIYARYSSHNQREESIEGQLRVCQQYADQNDFTVIQTYTDSALSGRTDKRPGFQMMISDAKKKLFDTILIYSVDRFSRDRYDTAVYKKQLKDCGVSIIAVTQPMGDGAESIVMESVLEGFAHYYSANLSRNVKRGHEENARRHKSNGGPRPLGYRTGPDGYYQIDEYEAGAVRMIFQMYNLDKSKREIIAALNQAGYKTSKGKDFNDASLHRILKNRKYMGHYTYDGADVPDAIPAIIDTETFNKAQERMAQGKRRGGHMNTDELYLLSGKVFCGKCGKPMIGESGTSATGTVYRYYKCAGRKRALGCDKASEKKGRLEDTVLDYLRNVVLSDEMIEQLAQRVYKLVDDTYTDLTKVETMTKQLREVQKQIDNVNDAIAQGIFTRSTKAKLDELEEEEERLKWLIVKEQVKKPNLSVDSIKKWLCHIKTTKDAPNFDRTLVDSLLKAVYVFDDDDTGEPKHLTIVTNIKGLPEETISLSDAVAYGPPFVIQSNPYINKYGVWFYLVWQ